MTDTLRQQFVVSTTVQKHSTSHPPNLRRARTKVPNPEWRMLNVRRECRKYMASRRREMQRGEMRAQNRKAELEMETLGQSAKLLDCPVKVDLTYFKQAAMEVPTATS